MPKPSGARQLLAAALAEPGVLRAGLRAIGSWLRRNKEAVLGADTESPPDLARWQPRNIWDDLVTETILPAVGAVWDEQWRQRRALRDPDAWRADYFSQVRSRLRDFPAESFEAIRGELAHGTGRGESIRQLRDRIGRALAIDAPSRAVLDRIMDAQAVIDDRRAGPETRAAARKRIKRLEGDLAEADQRWHWRAERIARTETSAAFGAGAYAAAEAAEAQYGDRIVLQWWATRDTRTRHTHRAAHGQTVPVGEYFTVGQARLRFPGDPTSSHPEEVINCRCVVIERDR